MEQNNKKTEIRKITFDDISSYLGDKKTDTVLVVVDVLVWELYSEVMALDSLKDKKIHVWKCPQGDKTKTILELEKCLEYFLNKGVHRNVHLVAIGGGATSDFAGLVSALLLRGISWSVIPTTLLSMVDAAIGGKVAINSQQGKNLIGSFHLPDEVLMNPIFLDSLPPAEHVSGLGEILKYGFLSKEISLAIEQNKELSDIIMLCSKYKQSLVEKDLYERGERVQLNLGHTFGHAIELIYEIPHGEAIMWGMLIIFKLEKREDLVSLLRQWKIFLNWDISTPPWYNKTFPLDKIRQFIERDKKKINQKTLNLVCIEEIGKFKTREISVDEVFSQLGEISHELRSFHF